VNPQILVAELEALAEQRRAVPCDGDGAVQASSLLALASGSN
jgi:hypothetical protein